MLRGPRTSQGALTALLLAAGLALAPANGPASEPNDPLAAEIERWSAFLRNHTSSDEIWTEIKQGSEPALARARDALRDGRRLLALLRLVSAREDLAAAAYLSQRAAGPRADTPAFEAEWRRLGDVLGDALVAPSSDVLGDLRPAAVRAIGEAALPQVRVYYQASLEYGRHTLPEYGLFYLGAAQAQREVAAFCRTLSAASPLAAPPLRVLDAELRALEAELLAAYRPPASIDKHREFIAASSTLKDASELNAAGLRYGALLRYLQAALRLAPLRPDPPAFDAAVATQRLRALIPRLAAGGVDHSLGQLFLESAQADLAAAAPGAGAPTAAAIASDVLPRYFAALEPARPEAPRPAPVVTVTLVRWPYT